MLNPRQFGRPVTSDDLPKVGGLEGIADAFEATRRTNNSNSARLVIEEAYAEQIEAIEAELGERLRHPDLDHFDEVETVFRDGPRYGSGNNPGGVTEDMAARRSRQRAIFEEELARLREKHPGAQSLYDEAERRRRYQARAQGLEVQRGRVAPIAGFIGDVGGAFTDPYTIITAPIGGSAKTILGAAVKNAAASGAVETLLQPGVQEARAELGLSASFLQGASNVAAATVAGGILGGGVKGAEKAIGFVSRETLARFGARSDDPVLRGAGAELSRELEIEGLAKEILPEAGPVETGQVASIVSAIERAYGGSREAIDELAGLQRVAAENGTFKELSAPVDDVRSAAPGDVEPAPTRQAAATRGGEAPGKLESALEPELKPRVGEVVSDQPKKGEAGVAVPERQRIEVDPATAFDDPDPNLPAARQQTRALAAQLDSLGDDAVLRIEDGVDANGNPIEREITKAGLVEEIAAGRRGTERLRGCLV